MHLPTALGAFLLLISALPSFGDNPYENTGLPAPDKVWRGPEYLKAAELISQGKSPFPMLKHPEGKKIHERMVHFGNLAYFTNTAIPINERLADYVDFQQGLTVILTTYASDANQRGSNQVHAEMAQIIAYGLRVSEVGVKLVQEFLPQVPKDGNYEARMTGLRQMYMGVMSGFDHARVTLTEKKFYNVTDLALVLATLHETLPTLKTTFTPEFKKEQAQKLRELQFSGKGADMLKEMAASLEAP